jgi:hypothetical protein
MDDTEDQMILKNIISKLYDYSISGTEMKIFISSQRETRLTLKKFVRHYRVVICPYKEGYRGKTPDIPNMTLLYSETVPFIGTRDMKAHEVMPIVHRILTGEEKDGAKGKWFDRDTDR